MESANVKVQNIFQGRNNNTCSTYCKYRTDATQCTYKHGFFRYIIVNILHKSDNKDYDDDDNNKIIII